MSQDAAISIALRLVDQATTPMNQAMAMVERSTHAAEQRMRSLDKAASILKTTFAAITAGLGVRELINTADEYQNLHGRLRLVTTSAEELAAVEKQLYSLSQESRQGYVQTIDLYTRIARSTKDLNITDSQRLTVTDAINKSLVVSGTAANSAQAAIVQLGQGFASGVLRGEELNSVLEQAPRLAEAIADGMGVSVGQLRALGKEGKLTAEEVVKALISQSEAVNREFSEMPKTVGQALSVVNNSLGKLISNTDQAGGLTGILAENIISVADAMDDWGDRNKEATTVWLKDFKLGLMSTQAEIMRLSMLLDKAGGTMTFLASLPSAIPSALGVKSSQERMQRMADYNIMYENRYAETDRQLMALAERYNALESGVGASAPSFAGRTGRGSHSPTPDENAIKLAKKLADQWADTRRDLEQQINLSGLDGLDKELLQITQRADELREKFGDQGLIDAWMAAAENSAIQTDYLDRQKKAQDELKKTTESYHDAMVSSLPEYEQAVAKVAQQYRELDIAILDAHTSGIISAEKAIEIQDQLSVRQIEAMDAIKDKTDDLSQFQIQAYRNMQDAGADFFESLRTGSDDWLDSFTEMTLKMVDQWAAAQMMMGLFGSDFAKGGDLGGLLGTAATSLAGMFGGSGGITSAAAPGTSYTGSYDSMVGTSAPFDFAFADGGWIKEPVVGVGLRSGGRYSFAENESELVMNQSQVRASSARPSSSAPQASATTPISITIIAADAQSITDMMRRNPQAVLGPLNEALQRGDRGLISNMRLATS